MNKRLIICVWYLAGIFLALHAQDSNISDSARVRNERLISQDRTRTLREDTIGAVITGPRVTLTDSIVFNKVEFKPDPKKAVLYSAIFPGLGQLYNRKYWKLPIIYGGVLGLTYAITWNGRTYGDYKQAFSDLVTQTGNSYENFFPGSPDDYTGGRQGLQDHLKRQKDFYRRNRDLAIIIAVGVYGLCMLDAYVDAQLYDFDMSPDLSMRVTPVFWPPTAYTKAGFGLQCSINF